MENQLSRRLQLIEVGHSQYTVGGYGWGSYSRTTGLKDAKVEQLEYFKNIIQQYNGQIKVRIEEPGLTLYADNEDVLLDIACTEADSLTEVHRPISPAAVDALNRGEYLLKKPIEYTHKVVFKESAVLSAELKANIYDYLTNLGDVIKMTRSCERNLTERRFWFTSTYFYTKDESILTFLNLIAPGTIAGIYKLTTL